MLCEGISFQNLLGISLPLGEMDSNFLGETGLDSSGEVELQGSDSSECWDTAGEQSLCQDCRGCLLRMRAAGEVLRSTGGYSISLILDDFAWRRMYCSVEPLSGELRSTWPCSLAEPTLVPWGIEQLDCSDNSLLPLFLVSPAMNSFVSYANIYELANYCQCTHHKLNLGRSSQNKTEKRKKVGTFN